MSVWFAIPSARPIGEAQALFNKWQSLGFLTAAFRDVGSGMLNVDMLDFGKYQGYPQAVNALCKRIVNTDSRANIIVVAGDDYDPDPLVAPSKVELEFTAHFKGTFGVMQPTGDRWMLDAAGTCASERVCDSPWIGREFIQRMYNGNGPICEEYFHFFEDEELHEVALKLGVLWLRPDIQQYHAHWSRLQSKRPAHLQEAKLDWGKAKTLFNSRKESGFPGHEPLPLIQDSKASVS